MEEEENDIQEIKIILLGDSGVGKSNIILRYYQNKFDPNKNSSIGSNFITKEIIKNNIPYILNIWDTTGQEKYHSVTKLFVQNSNIIILVYSLDSKASFEALDYWYKTSLDICEKDTNIVYAIVANKSDLFDDEELCQITDEEGKKYAEEKNLIFKLISAKVDQESIDSLFDEVLDEYLKKNEGSNLIDSFKIGKMKKEKKNDSKKNCC